MKLSANKQLLVDKFLSPVSRIVDKCAISLCEDKIFTLASNDDATIILYSSLNFNTGIKKEEATKINIPDIKKLVRVFECIDENNVDLQINSNNIEYNNTSVKFRYHLLENEIKSIVNVDKIKALTFNTDFELTQSKLNEIIKGSSFATETNKLYFSIENNKVLAELTDKNIQNTDNISFQIADSFNGEGLTEILPFNLDVFRLLLGLKSNMKVRVNNKLKILMFDITETNYTLKYIVSALVK